MAGLLVCVLSAIACTDHRAKWEGRYTKAREALDGAKSNQERFSELPDAAEAGFGLGKLDAATYATELLDLAPEFPKDWSYGNAIHDGHMVRIALRQDDTEKAKDELLLAGATPGSPQLDSFGPNMALARDLLEKNEPEAVVEYFKLCNSFWELEDGRLRRWTVLAEAGEMPDFAANLLY